jgi:Ca-activated chloride channel family protein
MITSPVLTNVAVDFGKGFEVHSVSPGAFPDVFAQRPLTVYGKYRGTPEGEIRVSGTGGGGRGIDLRVPLNSQEGAKLVNPALRFLWARSRIAELADDHALAPDSETKQEVTTLGLTHGLLTEFTSFVAVDTEVRKAPEGVDRETVRQPLPMPQGVPATAVGGGTVPEPATFLLWLTGMGAYAWRRFFGNRRKES